MVRADAGGIANAPSAAEQGAIDRCHLAREGKPPAAMTVDELEAMWRSGVARQVT